MSKIGGVYVCLCMFKVVGTPAGVPHLIIMDVKVCTVPVALTCTRMKVGSIVKRIKVPWWKGPDAVVQDWCNSPDQTEYSVTLSYTSNLVDGDKVVTLHGQKGVCYVLPEADMPWVISSRGDHVVVDMVVSTLSLTKRGTAGQEMEGSHAVQRLRDMASGQAEADTPPPKEEWGYLYDGYTGCPVIGPDGHPTTCTWGIPRVALTYHLASQKAYYTVGGASARGHGRLRSGAVKLGEMECQMAVATGLVNSISELRDRSSAVVQYVCRNCHCMLNSCACNEPDTDKVAVNSGLVKLDRLMTCSMGVSLQLQLAGNNE